MMQDQKLLTLHWRSFLGGGSDIIAAILSHKAGQNFDYSSILSHRCLMIQDARMKIVDAPLTLILWETVAMSTLAFLASKAANTLIMCYSDHVLCLIMRLTRPEIVEVSLTLISRIGQWVCQYPFCLYKPPIQSVWKDVTMAAFVCRKCKSKYCWRST